MMTTLNREKMLLASYADLLEYPSTRTIEVSNFLDVLYEVSETPPCEHYKEFLTYVMERPLGELQEHYVSTFDLSGQFVPYLGYHLYGEGYERSTFMVELIERYRRSNFEEPKTELPDHLIVILRFLSSDEVELNDHSDLIDSTVKVLGQIVGGGCEGGNCTQELLKDSGNFYPILLKLLYNTLQQLTIGGNE